MTDYPDIWPDSDAFIGVCQDCCRTCLVRRTTCPYAKEINGEIDEITVCASCHYERGQDI